MAVHELKTWPEYYRAILRGHKRFEYRKNDRGFAVQDVLWLREWDPETETYTGCTQRVRVTYILPIPDSEYVVLSIEETKSLPGEHPWGNKMRLRDLSDHELPVQCIHVNSAKQVMCGLCVVDIWGSRLRLRTWERDRAIEEANRLRAAVKEPA